MKNGPSEKPCIVLIEDNPSDVYLMGIALEQSGLVFELTSFQSGTEAFPILCPDGGPEQNPDDPLIPDLIMLDLNTPGPDGFEILARIRSTAKLAGVPVAIVTSSESPDDKRRAALLGATMFIQKPTQLTAFIDDVGKAVKTLLAMGKPAVQDAA
jgi:two-component system, chemotaxis family, response regulator Rcp1